MWFSVNCYKPPKHSKCCIDLLLTLLHTDALVFGLSLASVRLENFDCKHHIALIPQQQRITFSDVMGHKKL
jgi:hypothetical protein